MKSRILIIMAFLICACKPAQEPTSELELSKYECSMEAAGGEDIIDVLTYYPFDFSYSEDWLLIRNQKDRIKVVVDPNPSDDERSAQIGIICDGEEVGVLTVTQSGLSLSLEQKSVSIDCFGGKVLLEVESNVDWTLKNESDWMAARKDDSRIALSVERNYSMSDRRGEILIKAGDVTSVLRVAQEASPWYQSIEMIPVEGGSFVMGAQNQYYDEPNYDEDAYIIEAPVRVVSVSDFSIAKYEVSQAQWIAAMGDNPSAVQGDALPVEMVSWNMVQDYIAKLNEMTGLKYRLPTEAEWEFAAKGGTGSSGYLYSGASVLSLCGWYYSNSDAMTHEVGSKYANELGIFDMSGNVREWCQDWFDYYDETDLDNPLGPYDGVKRVNRGGAWTTPAINCRNSYRGANYPDEMFSDLGFRLVLEK